MSEAIKKMLAEREQVGAAIKVAKARKVVKPAHDAFLRGFRFISAYYHPRRSNPRSAEQKAFAEGCEFAMRVAGDKHAEDWAWRESVARLEAMEAFEAAE